MATRKAIAKREWTAGGTEVEEEQATGFRYTLLGNGGKPFEYTYGENADSDRMLAIFGGLTLCGNVVSGAKDDEDEMDAVRARFENLKQGIWVQREGGFGPRYDSNVLAQVAAELKGGSPDDYLRKIDTEVEIGGKKVKWQHAVMRIPQFKDRYYQLKPAKAAEAPSIDQI